MSTCNASKKVLKASGDASARNVQHILVVLKPDGTLALSGSDNIVHAIIADVELYNKFQTIVNSSRRQDGSKVDHVEVLTYPMLPCSPYSSKFKGSLMIRKVLDNMVSAAGYGKYGKKLGQGEAPLGWPEYVCKWENYEGAARSKLTNVKMKQIIISMLEAANIDPATHVLEVANEEAGEPTDVIDDENINAAGEEEGINQDLMQIGDDILGEDEDGNNLDNIFGDENLEGRKDEDDEFTQEDKKDQDEAKVESAIANRGAKRESDDEQIDEENDKENSVQKDEEKKFAEQNDELSDEENNNAQKVPDQDEVDDNLGKLLFLANELSEKDTTSNTEGGEDGLKKRKRFI